LRHFHFLLRTCFPSFLFEGQGLYSLLNLRGTDASGYILAAIISHFMGLLTCGLFIRSQAAAKSMMLGYDQNTSTATCSYENEAGRGTADLTFTSKDGNIHLSIYWVYTNEEIDQTYIMESKGIKID